MRIPVILLVVFLFPVCFVACSSSSGDAIKGCAKDACIAATCTAGTAWQAPGNAFSEGTEAWGLQQIGVEGVRINAVDVNSDGWPDLMVRRGSVRSDDFASGGLRSTWLLINDQNGHFIDTTQQSGIVALRDGGASEQGRPGEVYAFADVDNDGDLDVYVGTDTSHANAIPGQTSELLLNDGSGNFILGPKDSPLRRVGEYERVAGASFVDYDRDGFVDLWITQDSFTDPDTGSFRFMQDRLYRGVGDGNFVEVTTEAGLQTSDWTDLATINEARGHTRAWSSAACDVNNDGITDLLASSYGRSPNHLWQGMQAQDGTVSFVNRSVASGYAFDEDQTWQDNEQAKCYCRDNPTAEGCDGAPSPRIGCSSYFWQHAQDREPFRLGGNSGATVCADINNDQNLDLLTSEIRHWWAGQGADGSQILANVGGDDVTFQRLADTTTGLAIDHIGVSWDEGHITASLFDFDNDGWLDVYTGGTDYDGNRGYLHRQVSPLVFEAVPVEQGIDHHRSHGSAIADFDRDGDLDIVVGHSRARCSSSPQTPCYDTAQVRLFENTMASGGNWIQVELVGSGVGTNGSAIGARITIETASTVQTREIEGGHGHFGAQNDLVQHIGLGEACEATVTVRWPNDENTEQVHTLVSGHKYHIVEGQGITLIN